MIKVAIVGANGYTGFELMRLLATHREVELIAATSRSLLGKSVSEAYPPLGFAYGGLKYTDSDVDALKEADICFTALPHTAGAEIGGKLFDAGVKVIDLSADFRYDDTALYESTYGVTHPRPELNGKAVYGLCELNREKIRKAAVVGNPGCYTTASILPLYPLIKEGVISSEDIIIDAASGASGAGRKSDYLYNLSESGANFKAYGVFTHRHRTEIEEKLGAQVTFTPHLLPVSRGILCTIYCKALKSAATLEKVYADYYGKEKFVRFTGLKLPELNWVRGSNYCAIGYAEKDGKFILVSAIDNLVKGASGQAIQNMNIMMGLNEAEGLMAQPIYL